MKRNLVVGIALGLAVFVLAFVFVVRPWYLRWGTTDAEISMRLPGDQFTPAPIALSTRAITIEALAFWLGLPMLIYIAAGGFGGWMLDSTPDARAFGQVIL